MRDLLNVSFNEENGSYKVSLAEGSNVAETMFAIAVIIRCLLRENLIDNIASAIDTITKYATDEQFNEVKDDNI